MLSRNILQCPNHTKFTLLWRVPDSIFAVKRFCQALVSANSFTKLDQASSWSVTIKGRPVVKTYGSSYVSKYTHSNRGPIYNKRGQYSPQTVEISVVRKLTPWVDYTQRVRTSPNLGGDIKN